MEIKRFNQKTYAYKDQLSTIREFNIREEKCESFILNPNNVMFLALEQGHVIGFAWGYILERMDNESMLYIHSVDVLKEHQRKGVGTALMNAFLDLAKNNHFRNVFLITDEENLPANHLYQKFSYELETKKNLYIFK